MLFNFPVMQTMYLSLARRGAGPLKQTLDQLPAIPSDSQWANFARNHDLMAAARDKIDRYLTD